MYLAELHFHQRKNFTRPGLTSKRQKRPEKNGILTIFPRLLKKLGSLLRKPRKEKEFPNNIFEQRELVIESGT